MEDRLEELRRNYVGAKVDYLRTHNSLNIVKAIKNIKRYQESMNQLAAYMINNHFIKSILELSNFLNNIEAYTYTKYGLYQTWNEKRAGKYYNSLLKEGYVAENIIK